MIYLSIRIGQTWISELQDRAQAEEMDSTRCYHHTCSKDSSITIKVILQKEVNEHSTR